MTTANQAVLTEDAILKMSEDDYMNDVQLEFFRDRLRQMERDIRNNAGETTEHLRETVSMRWSCVPATASASC